MELLRTSVIGPGVPSPGRKCYRRGDGGCSLLYLSFLRLYFCYYGQAEKNCPFGTNNLNLVRIGRKRLIQPCGKKVGGMQTQTWQHIWSGCPCYSWSLNYECKWWKWKIKQAKTSNQRSWETQMLYPSCRQAHLIFLSSLFECAVIFQTHI